MLIRSQPKTCLVPSVPVTGPSRRKISSNARGQSSSVPSSSPIKCLVSVTGGSRRSRVSLAESRHVMSDLGAPGRPVVRDAVSPQIQFVPGALVGEPGGERPGAWQRPGGVFPLALTADQQQADPAAEPIEVIAVQVADIVKRVVEIRGGAALAPAVPCGRVV